MENKLIIFTGPSAVGKATIEKELFKDEDLKLCFSISATTRLPREGEVDGKHYYFLTSENFEEKIKENAFLEWNKHFSNKYGTLKSEIQRINNLGFLPFLEVDVMGAKKIIEEYPKEQIISIFIAPPSIEDLKERLLKRGTEDSSQVEQRLARVKEELKCKKDFQYVVINDEITSTIEKVKNIIRSNK